MSIIQLEYYNRYGDFLRTSSRVFENIEDAISYGNYIIKISRFGRVEQRPSSFRVRWLTLKSSAVECDPWQLRSKLPYTRTNVYRRNGHYA